MKLQELDTLSSFALFGPGWQSDNGAWTLYTDLEPHDGSDGLVLLGFEEQVEAACTWRHSEPRAVHPLFEIQTSMCSARISMEGYDSAVRAIHEAIALGDVYQVCLTRQAQFAPCSGASILAALCARSVPTYAAWVRLPDGRELVSGSPELFFRIHEGLVHTMPMKGTAPLDREEALDASEKERAELAMITDLLRNDLRAVCAPKSIRVLDARMKVRLPYAVQTVSHIVGEVAEGMQAREVLAALHPGGSITGAPKQAARAQIAELEPTPRGLYTGALGFIRGADTVFSLLIRTAVKSAQGWSYGVGGGITIDSDAEDEWAEMMVKLSAVCASVELVP